MNQNNPSGFIPGDVVTLTLTLSHTALSATAAFDLLVGVSIPLICSNAKVVSVSNDDLAVSDRILQLLYLYFKDIVRIVAKDVKLFLPFLIIFA